MVLGFLKRKIIKASEISFPETSLIIAVDSMQGLWEVSNEIVETPNDFFAQRDSVVLRFTKESAQPRLIHIKSLEMNVDAVSFKIEVELEEIMRMAKQGMLSLFESDDGMICLPGDPFIFARRKKQ